MRRTALRRKTPLARTGSLKRTPLRKVSKRQSARNRAYTPLRRAFLTAHPICQVCRAQQATDIHHMAGRGSNTNDPDTFLATCRRCHDGIHVNPSWARAHGWLV